MANALTDLHKFYKDNYKQKGSADFDSSSKSHTYKMFKSIFGYEEYLSILTTKLRKTFARFRTSSHHLPVETGRWLGIPINDIRCTLCNSRQIADEMNFVLE